MEKGKGKCDPETSAMTDDLDFKKLMNLGTNHLSEGDYDAAAKYFTEAIKYSTGLKDKAVALCLKSKAALICGNIVEAIEDAFHSTQICPSCIDGFVRLCEALFAVGDREKARTVALEGLNFDGLNTDLKDLLGRARAERQNKSFAFFFLQQVIGCNMEERPTILRSWDKNLKEDAYTAILECWSAVLVHTMSDQATVVMSPSLSTLLKEILITASSSQLIADICHACYSFDDAQNRTLMLQISIAGWSQFVPLSSPPTSTSSAAYCLCLGHAYQSLPASEPFNVERAISCFRRALLALNSTDFPQQWAAAHLGLGQAYRERFRGDPEQNIAAAIEHFKLSISLIDSDSSESFRKATVLFEVVGLYDAVGMLDQCVEHVRLCLAALDADRSSEERQLKASVHRFAASMFVRESQRDERGMFVPEPQGDEQGDEQVAAGRGFDARTVGFLEEAIQHYQQVLQLYSVHEYPIATLMIKTEVAKLKMWSSNTSTFELGGLVCYVDIEDRRSVVVAHQGFVEALAGAEACAMVFHGYTSTESNCVDSVCWLEIQDRLSACFSGCIETSVRLGNYAQALAYSERSRVHDILGLLLALPLRPWLLKSMLPDDVAEFLKLRARLNKYAQYLQMSTHSSRLGTGDVTFSADSRLHGMLRDAAKMTMLFRNIGENSGGKKMKLLQQSMPPIMDIDPIIWEQSLPRDRDEIILEWYLGKDKAFAFIISEKNLSPKTIEFNTQQTYTIIEATRDFLSVAKTMSRTAGAISDNCADPILQSLADISQAIRLDVILASIPLHAKRLIVIPHGILCGVPFSALPCDLKPGSAAGLESHFSPTYLLDRFALGVVCVHSLKMLQWCEDRGANLRFAPLLQGMALHRQNASKFQSDGKENARLDAEYACLRKSLGKLSIEHQVQNDSVFICVHALQKFGQATWDRHTDEISLAEEHKDDEARKSAHLVSMSNADVVHCTCSSSSNIDRSFSGSLEFGHNECMDATQISAWYMARCRLVNLSANKQVWDSSAGHRYSILATIKRQGQKKAHSCFGYKGLPLGFLLAGSSCVIETLWQLEHDCRVIFWGRFFDNLVSEGKDVSETLRLTQLWLRDVSELEFLKSYPKELSNPRVVQRIEELQDIDGGGTETERLSPYRSPFFWAGIRIWGDGMVSGQKKSEAKKMYDYHAAASKYAVSPGLPE